MLVYVASENPAVWVFDPHDRENGIQQVVIDGKAKLEELVEEVRARVERTNERLGVH